MGKSERILSIGNVVIISVLNGSIFGIYEELRLNFSSVLSSQGSIDYTRMFYTYDTEHENEFSIFVP